MAKKKLQKKKAAARKKTVKKSKAKQPKLKSKASPQKSAKKPSSQKGLAPKGKTLPKKSGSTALNADPRLGKKAPDFSVMNDAGEVMRLSDFKGKRLVIYFYPKDMTPGCTTESCDFRDSFTKFTAKGIQVLGVSRDSVKSHQKFKEKHGLPFPLLSDEDGKMCEAYQVWVEKSMYGRKYMGIERSTFVIDETGCFQHVYSKVSVTGHVDQVLKDMGIA